ncbi:MAG: NUDIX domain-containing protein [bacterium]|nr:NUDIX domain-containing protein [bacterium]
MMEKAVWCYLLREIDGVMQVCLAPKLKLVGSQNYVAGKLNAAGGHLEPNEEPVGAAIREIAEEQGVVVRGVDLEPKGLVVFLFPGHEQLDLLCYVFTTKRWQGEPQATTALGEPEWHVLDQLPFDRLPDSDRYWLPLALTGGLTSVVFHLDGDYHVLSHQLIPRSDTA